MPTRNFELPLLATLGAEGNTTVPTGLPIWYVPPEARRELRTLGDLGRGTEG